MARAYTHHHFRRTWRHSKEGRADSRRRWLPFTCPGCGAALGTRHRLRGAWVEASALECARCRA